MSIGLAIVFVAIIGFAIYSRGFRRIVLIVVGVAVAGAALLFYNSSTSDYRDCVALMRDRKHPVEVKRRQEEARLRECEADRLRDGRDCDCKATKGQTGYCGGTFPGYDPKLAHPELYPEREPAADACEHLSLDELRHADAEASRDTPR